jgi:DNA-binding CsgD family transcriptional regulator
MNRHNQDTSPGGVPLPRSGGVAVSSDPTPIGVREAVAVPAGAGLSSLIRGKAENGVVMLYLCPLLSGADSVDSFQHSGDSATAVASARARLEESIDKDVSEEGEAAAVRLTATETNVMRLLAEGKTNRAIAHEMFISINTVKTHVRAIFQKLGVNTRGCAVTRAVVTGLIDWPGPEAPKITRLGNTRKMV